MEEFRTSTYMKRQLADLDRDDSHSSEERGSLSAADSELLGAFQAVLVEAVVARQFDTFVHIHAVQARLEQCNSSRSQ
jgi:hypothetical protein